VRWFLAIPATLGSLVAVIALSAYLVQVFPDLDLAAPIACWWLGTALWASLDSRKIQLKKYKSGISFGPVALLLFLTLFWYIGMPWYLHTRYRITNGLAELKDRYVRPWHRLLRPGQWWSDLIADEPSLGSWNPLGWLIALPIVLALDFIAGPKGFALFLLIAAATAATAVTLQCLVSLRSRWH